MLAVAPKKKAPRKDRRFFIRVVSEEWKQCEAAARAAGLSLSAWARKVLVEAAVKEKS